MNTVHYRRRHPLYLLHEPDVDVFVVWGHWGSLSLGVCPQTYGCVSMKLLMFSTYTPFRAVRVFAAQLNTASESTNYIYCVNSVRWLNLTVASSINLSAVTATLQRVGR